MIGDLGTVYIDHHKGRPNSRKLCLPIKLLCQYIYIAGFSIGGLGRDVFMMKSPVRFTETTSYWNEKSQKMGK